MLARDLPDGTFSLTNIQDRVPVMYDWGLPLHLADQYATIFVTRGEGTYAHEKIKVYNSDALENLGEVSRAYRRADTTERRDGWGCEPNESGECICERCKELATLL